MGLACSLSHRKSDVKYNPQPSRPSGLDDEHLYQLAMDDPHQPACQLEEALGYHNQIWLIP